MNLKTFQERTLEQIAAIAEANSMETTIATDWANTGHVYLHEKGVHRPRGSVHFDFQSDSYTLRITFDGRRIPSQAGRADYFDFLQDVTQPTRFWDVLDSVLRTRPR